MKQASISVHRKHCLEHWQLNQERLPMTAIYRAAIMDAETGGNSSYTFQAASDLFSAPAREIVDTFLSSLDRYGKCAGPLSYELDSAVVKAEKQVVLASGSLGGAADGTPFVLIISPVDRRNAEAQ
jgi:hypothetical protein